MKILPSLLVVVMLVAVGVRPAAAQSSRDQAEAHALYAQANHKPLATTLRAGLVSQTSGFFGGTDMQPGALRTFDGRYRPVPGLRYHAGLRLLEAQDSINLDSTHLWPVGSLRGFDLGEPGSGTPVRRFRPHLVKEGSAGTRRDYVEVLTAVDAGPLLLGWLFSNGADATTGRLSLEPMLMVGAGNDANEPLHSLELNQSSVLKLFGKRAEDVSGYAMRQELKYFQAEDVAKMIDYFNKRAVVK